MTAEPKPPFIVVLCCQIVQLASYLVPGEQRELWRQEWRAEVWHQWRFCLDVGQWNLKEALRLVRSCLGAFPDAAWHCALRETLRNRLGLIGRSPWTCLGAFGILLLVVTWMSGGLLATRAMLRRNPYPGADRMLTISLHSPERKRERGLEPDILPFWAKNSHLLEDIAPFRIESAQVSYPGHSLTDPLLVVTEPHLFTLLGAHTILGAIPDKPAVVLSYQAWRTLFHANPAVLGTALRIERRSYRIAGVLASGFHFPSRQSTAYLVVPSVDDRQVMMIARTKPGVERDPLRKELTHLAWDTAYYFEGAQLRLEWLRTTSLAPIRFFGVAVLLSSILVLFVGRVQFRYLRTSFRRKARRDNLRKTAFFLAKSALALSVVFLAGLEVSRPTSSLLLMWEDAGSGPTLVWFYIAGSMGALFWALADQRARCRVCLRLLCFPVRMGCPGYLFLEWAGTEFLCPEGHGVLHVPHLAPSWDEESERWISMDDSWRALFSEAE